MSDTAGHVLACPCWQCKEIHAPPPAPTALTESQRGILSEALRRWVPAYASGVQAARGDIDAILALDAALFKRVVGEFEGPPGGSSTVPGIEHASVRHAGDSPA